MSTNTPVLYVFAISHYCEKARWALDHFGIDYQLRHVAPGEHGEIAKKLGAPKSSVPYLSLDGRVIQGSANIISWAEEKSGSTPFSAACSEIERRIDDVAGVHVRRFYYSEALVEHPSMVRRLTGGWQGVSGRRRYCTLGAASDPAVGPRYLLQTSLALMP